ncbi:MAG: hypothetical protein V4548_00005 [Bacteroidota bacterium]
MTKIALNIFTLLIPIYLFSQETKIDSLRIINAYSLCKVYSDTLNEPVDKDWLLENIDIVKNNLNIITEKINTVEELEKIMPNYKFQNEHSKVTNFELENDIKSTLIEIWKGTGSYNIDFVSENNLILKMRIIVDFEDRFIKDYLIPHINFKLECINGKATFEKTFIENLKNIKNKNLFIESSDQNYRRKTALNYFVDVYSNGEYREPYYFEYNLGQQTFDHIRYFILNKDYQAMETLLYSVSPTSRLLFARTLKYMIANYNYKPSQKILDRITEIRKHNRLIKSEFPSLEMDNTEYQYFDLDKNFELYLKTE